MSRAASLAVASLAAQLPWMLPAPQRAAWVWESPAAEGLQCKPKPGSGWECEGDWALGTECTPKCSCNAGTVSGSSGIACPADLLDDEKACYADMTCRNGCNGDTACIKACDKASKQKCLLDCKHGTNDNCKFWPHRPDADGDPRGTYEGATVTGCENCAQEVVSEVKKVVQTAYYTDANCASGTEYYSYFYPVDECLSFGHYWRHDYGKIVCADDGGLTYVGYMDEGCTTADTAPTGSATMTPSCFQPDPNSNIGMLIQGECGAEMECVDKVPNTDFYHKCVTAGSDTAMAEGPTVWVLAAVACFAASMA